MDKPIEQYTEVELMSVIRLAENSNVPGSRYQKAKNEWDMRQQIKIAQAVDNKKGGIFFEVGGDMINDGVIHTDQGATVGVSVAGNYTSKKGKVLQGKFENKKTWFSMDNPLVWLLASIILAGLIYCLHISI